MKKQYCGNDIVKLGRKNGGQEKRTDQEERKEKKIE
jgi:hypothetical protein